MRFALALILVTILFAATPALAQEVRIRDLGRFSQDRQAPLYGLGLVVGLPGTGDSPRNAMTQQALANVLGRLRLTIPEEEVQSRNVAAVAVTAMLPSTIHAGDRIDATVSSLGDARSLAGGTLLFASLTGPDQREYAAAQGPLVVGGFRFDADFNREQRNSPSSGQLPDGATVLVSLAPDPNAEAGDLLFILEHPDLTTAERIAAAVNGSLGDGAAYPQNAGAVRIRGGGRNLLQLGAAVENLWVNPQGLARVVVNERSGTVVAGAEVRISSVVISQGDIRVSVEALNEASQPGFYAGRGGDVRSLVVTNTRLIVGPEREDAVVSFPNSTVADLVEGLHRAQVDTRGVISILQAMKAAGALHAEILVQ